MDNNYNILSLDGGGIKGLILLEQLVVLEQLLNTNINKVFNMISGTSTGGIIAVLLSLGYSASDLLSIYTIHGENIFKKKWYRLGLFRPKYDDKYFNELIKKYVGNNTLKDIKNDLLVIGYNASKNNKIIFKSLKAKSEDNYNYSLFDVIRTTVAAPTYFKPHLLNKKNYCVDGGLVINNPSMISWVESLNYCTKETKINILSFSTGNIDIPISKKIAQGGKLNWAEPLVDIILAEQTETVDYHMTKLFNREPGIYIRCNSNISKSSGKMDDTSKENIKNMIIDGVNSAYNNYTLLDIFCKKIK